MECELTTEPVASVNAIKAADTAMDELWKRPSETSRLSVALCPLSIHAHAPPHAAHHPMHKVRNGESPRLDYGVGMVWATENEPVRERDTHRHARLARSLARSHACPTACPTARIGLQRRPPIRIHLP